MKTNVSTLLREFPKVRRAALAGEEVIIVTREGNLRLTAAQFSRRMTSTCPLPRMMNGDRRYEVLSRYACRGSGGDRECPAWLPGPRCDLRCRERELARSRRRFAGDFDALEKGRIVVAGDGLTFLSRVEGLFEIVPIDARIADLAAQLDLPHGDPFDRVITATAKVHGIPLLTRDRVITDSGMVDIIW